MRRGCFRRIPGRLSDDRGEQIQMPVHVAGERLRDLGFHFAVLLLQLVKASYCSYIAMNSSSVRSRSKSSRLAS